MLARNNNNNNICQSPSKPSEKMRLSFIQISAGQRVGAARFIEPKPQVLRDLAERVKKDSKDWGINLRHENVTWRPK